MAHPAAYATVRELAPKPTCRLSLYTHRNPAFGFRTTLDLTLYEIFNAVNKWIYIFIENRKRNFCFERVDRADIPLIEIDPNLLFNIWLNLANYYDARPLALAIASGLQSSRNHPEAMAPQEQEDTKPLSEENTKPLPEEYSLLSPDDITKPLPEEISLQVILWTFQAMFENRNAVPERTYEKALGSGKKILMTTEKHRWVR